MLGERRKWVNHSSHSCLETINTKYTYNSVNNQLNGFRQMYIYLLQVAMDHTFFGHSLKGVLFQYFTKLPSRCWPLIWSFLWLNQGKIYFQAPVVFSSFGYCNMSNLRPIFFSLAICWRSLSLPCHVALSIGKFHSMPDSLVKSRKEKSVSWQDCWHKLKCYHSTDIPSLVLYFADSVHAQREQMIQE